MDTKIRLTRKPMTTVLWMILTAAMALLLSVGAAMLYSSRSLAGILDKYHTSIAVRTDRAVYANELEDGVSYRFENKSFYQHNIDQLEAMDSVEGVYFHTLTGGYCPQLSPRISTGSLYMADESYDRAVVIGTITRMTEPEYHPEKTYDVSRIGGGSNPQVYTIGIEIKVEELVEGNPDYTKWDYEWFDGYINMHFSGSIAESLELFQVGQRYILYGGYDRSQWPLHDGFEDSGHAWLTNLGLDYFVGETGYAMASHRQANDKDGNLYISDGLVDGPTIARIDGTLNQFLAMPENAPWVELLEDQNYAQHSFPVIGTNALETMHIFVNQDANIVDGRFFTDEEYNAGERVCILNETAALDAGIAVGDTITLSQYLCHDLGGEEANTSIADQTDGKLNNPTVGVFQRDTQFVTQDEEFTVVGLYRLRNEWSDDSYAVTPNTIFIPKGVQIEGAFGGLASETEEERTNLDGTTETYTSYNEGASYGIYLSVKLKNGMVEDFENEIEGSDFAGQFLTLDQGFGKIQSTLNEISGAAGKLFWLVAAGWLLLLALYVLLYQGYQRKNLGIMRSLGASPKVARNYLWGSGMTVAAVGIVIGTVLAGSVLGVVQDRLFLHSFGMEVSKYSNAVLSQDAIDLMLTQSQLPIWVVLGIAGVQIGLFTLILWLQARSLSRLSPRALLSKT